MSSRNSIVWRGAPRFTQSELLTALNSRLPPSVDAAYLFGSYARGEAHDASDIDLLVVANTNERWPNRARALEPFPSDLEPVDIIVYTPTEWADAVASRTPLAQQVLSEGVRVR